MLKLRNALSVAWLAALVLPAAAIGAPTDPDPTFDGDGKVLATAYSSEQAIYSTVIQADGKIVAVGSNNGSQKWLILRFNADGTPDTTFGDSDDGDVDTTGDGELMLDPSTSFDSAYDVAIAPSGKLLVGGRVRNTTTGKTEFGAIRLRATDGAPDTTFNSGAVLSFEIDDGAAGNDAWLTSIAPAPSGRIVVGGYANDGAGNNTDFAFARINFNGTLDTALDGDGTGLKSIVAGAIDFLSDIAVQSDGSIVTFGTTADPSNFTRRIFTAARWTSTGSPDATFGAITTPGKALATTTTGYGATAVLRANGSWAMVGATADAPDDCLVVQFTSAGAIDTGFSGDGYQTVDFNSGNDWCTGIDEDSAERLLISGYSNDGSGFADAVFSRLGASGAPDTALDADGRVSLALTSDDDNFATIHGLTDGKILVGGYQGSNGAAAEGAVLMRFEGGDVSTPPPPKPADLALDTSFSGNGFVTSDFVTGRDDHPNGLVTAPDGSVFAVGMTGRLFSTSPLVYLDDPSVAKYTNSGELDSGFSGDGLATVGLTGINTADLSDGVLLSDGSLMVAGTHSSSGGAPDFFLAKFTPSGALDSSFDGDGWKVQDLGSTTDDRAETLHLLPDGDLLVTGTSGPIGDLKMAAARFDADGTLDGAYGDNGVASIDVNEWENEDCFDSALLSDESVVLAGYSIDGSDRAVTLVKFDSQGDPVSGFDADGIAVERIGSSESQVNGIAAQADGKLVVAGEAFDGQATPDAFAARFDSVGTLDSAGFGGGVQFVDFAGEGDSAADVAIDPVNGEITIGGSAGYGTDEDFGFARFDMAGAPLASFDSDGKGSVEISSGNDAIAELEIDAARRVVAGGTSNPAGLPDFAIARLPGLGQLPGAGGGPAPGGDPPPAAVGAPASKVKYPKHKGKYSPNKARKFSGSAETSVAGDAVTKIEIALRRVDSKTCFWLSSSSVKFKSSKPSKGKCSSLRWIVASGTTSWSYKLKKDLPDGDYELYVRARLASGAIETRQLSGTNKFRFTVR